MREREIMNEGICAIKSLHRFFIEYNGSVELERKSLEKTEI